MAITFQIRGTRFGLLSIFVPILASVGGFIFGYDTGQISSILIMDDFLRRFGHCNNPDGTDCSFGVWQEGAIVGMLSVGTLIGALVGSYFADLVGRRKAMTIECIIFIVGVLIQVTSFYSWAQITVGRGIAGLGVGGLSLAVPAYQAECAPRQIRGSLIGIYQLMITLGILVAACIDLGTNSISNSASWRIPVALGIVFGLILGIGILFMPESPRWLLKNGYREEAMHAIARLRGSPHDHSDMWVQHDLKEIENAVIAIESQGAATWAECFSPHRKTLYRTLLGMALQTFQQLTGANYFFYYGATIFTGVGIASPFVSQIILNSVNVVCTFLGLYVMERFGRRWPLIIGGLWCSAWLFVFSSVGVTHDPQTEKGSADVLITSACLFILGYASTWAPGVWILIGETFPLKTRAKQGSLATASNWFWNFMLAFFTQPVTGDIGFAYGYIFAGSNLVAAVTVYMFLYESAGLPLEAVDMMYNDPDCKPWTSGSWIPPNYSSRQDVQAIMEKKETGDIAMVENASEDTAVEGNGLNGIKSEKTEPLP